MSSSNLILTHWRKELKVFNKNFEILRKGSDKEAVHDLRVAIKKLRSYLKLFVFITEKKEWKYLFPETIRLFRILGKERDIELCLELILAYKKEEARNIFRHFIKYMRRQLLYTKGWSKEAVKSYPENELTKISLIMKNDSLLVDGNQLIKKIIDVINTQLQQIKKYYKRPHKIRKLLKDVYYWIKLLPGGAISDSTIEKKLNEMLDDFGIYQDEEMLLSKTRHYRKDYIPRPITEYKAIQLFEKKISNKKEKLLKEVLSNSRKLSKEILMSQ
ncbi:MAG: CHAD domain-containing protein [Chitinophagaceae bacterium]